MKFGQTVATERTIDIPCDCDDGICERGFQGTWLGESTRKNDQVLEVRRAYKREAEVCRDYVRVVTYEQITKNKGSYGVALEHIKGIDCARWYPSQLKKMMEWFVETVDKNWTPPRVPLALYLGEVVRDELRGKFPSPATRQGWAVVMQLAIDKYEKGITNEEETKD